jgi:urease alpha subunit
MPDEIDPLEMILPDSFSESGVVENRIPATSGRTISAIKAEGDL